MKFTPKQRREIYLKVALKIMKRERTFMCLALCDYFDEDYPNLDEEFPEFYLLGNRKIKDGSSWYGYSEGRAIPAADERITLLLFAAEMTKDAKQ